MNINIKKYKQIRAIVALFVSIIVSISVTQNSYLLAIIGTLTGMLFLTVVRSKTKIIVDEREKTIGDKAARMTYAIFTPTLGIGSFLLIALGKNITYLFAMGQVFAYLTLFLIALYSISYYFLNRIYGGSTNEK